MNTPQQLFDLYPYMFAEPNIGISIARGWLPIFQKLCQDVDTLLGADKHGFHFIQCKEKLGSARWYWTMSYIYPVMRIDLSKTWADGMSLNGQGMDVTPPASIREQIGALIDAATAKTKHSCIVCGAPGAGDPQGGWFLVLCDVHARQRRLGKLPTPWFE